MKHQNYMLPGNKIKPENCNFMPKDNYNVFLKTYIFVLIFLLIPIFLNYTFLRNSGEFLTAKQIFELQNNKDKINIYGSAIFNNMTDLKLYAYKHKKPKIISFGSSRSLQFRESFFSQPFYNMGSTASSIHEAINTAFAMLSNHCPQFVLLGVDFWWFNENFQKSDSYDLCFQKIVNSIDPAHLLLPFKWIKDGKVTVTNYVKLFTLSQMPHIGVSGKLRKTGIAADGSYYYTDLITGHTNDFSDVSFKDSRQRVVKGTDRFTHGSSASEIHFQKFLELLQLFQANNVKVVLFFPPLAPEINKIMKKYDYSYIKDLKKKFKKSGINVYDFTDPAKLVSTSNGEFIDGFHGGDVIYAKLLSYIASEDIFLKNYIKQNYLETVIQKYTGFAMIPNAQITLEKEVDFLNMGATKNINGTA